ncbi:dicarboxylate/amino acid:cation symporter [Thermoproteota archaeon]
MKLWMKIVIGLTAGIIVGVILEQLSVHVSFIPTVLVYIKAVGTLFINAIKMLVLPLIFSSLIVGITSMNDPKKMGRIGLKSLGLYLLTTALAITIGLTIGNVFHPGTGMNLESAKVMEVQEAPSMIDTLVGLIPSNPAASFADGHVLQVIIFSIFLGIAMCLIGDKAKPLANLFESLAEVMYKLTGIVMEFAPYGIFALIAWVAGTYGVHALIPLIKVVGAVFLGCAIHAVVVLGGSLVLAGLNPMQFFKGILDAFTVAFATTSSSGTLPVTLKCAEENLGVSKSIASFVLPLGATVNMNGTALYEGVCALFVAQAYGITLTFGNYFTIILTSTLAAVGTAGVPGAGLIMLTLVLTSVGLPLEGVAIIAGIDRLLDMARSSINVTGDALVAVLVAKSEKELDTTIYNGTSQI